MEQPWGTEAVILPKDQYELDEDGVIYVRTVARIPTRLALKYGISAESNPEHAVKLLVAGWNIKSGGRSLPYSEDAAADLPLGMLQAISDHLASPLVSAARQNGTASSSLRPAPTPAPVNQSG